MTASGKWSPILLTSPFIDVCGMHAANWKPDPVRVGLKARQLQRSRNLRLDRIMRKTGHKRPGARGFV